MFTDPSRFKVAVAGRRWGKTELALVALLTGCLSKPGLYRYIAPTQRLARRTLWRRKLKRAIDQSWLAKPLNETNLEAEFVNGSILEVMGAEDPTGLLGDGVAGAVLDEYASMRPEVWDEYVRPSLADTYSSDPTLGWALFIGTPKSFNHFHALFERGHNPAFPQWASWQHQSIENPLLDPGEIEEARRTTDPRTFRQEWEASFETIAGRAYYAFARQHHVRAVTWDPTLPARVCFDFNVHPATAAIGQVQGDRPVVWREVWVPNAGGEATKATALGVKQLLASVKQRGPVRIYGDATGKAAKTTGPADHAVLRELFASAVWCIPSVNPHEKDRVAAVNAVCETMAGVRRLLVDTSCVRVIADLEQVIYAANGELDKKSNPLLTHISDAVGYWLARDFPAVQDPAFAALHTGVSDTYGASETVAAMRAAKTAQRRRELGLN